MNNNEYLSAFGRTPQFQKYGTSTPKQPTSGELQEINRQFLGAFAQASSVSEDGGSFHALITPPEGSASVAAQGNLSIGEWIHKAALNVNKEGFEVSRDGDSSLVQVLYKGRYYASSYCMILVHNRETGDYLCWSSDLQKPLPVKILFRMRPRKSDLSFAIVFQNGAELTSDDPVSITLLLLLPKGDEISALCAAGIGGAEGIGGFGFSTCDRWVKACFSMCVTVSELLNGENQRHSIIKPNLVNAFEDSDSYKLEEHGE